MALSAKNKTTFVDGTLPRPIASNSLFLSWTRCNNMVMTSFSIEITQSIMFHDHASDMWTDLSKLFNQRNGPRVFQLKTHLHALQQGDHSVNNYFTKIKTLWDELKEFQPTTFCTCGALKSIHEFYNQDEVHQFMTSLNESYNSVRAQILLLDPLPPISKVCSMIVQGERQRTLGSSIPPLASVVQPHPNPNSQNN
ncbi:uncharacterized protein LOC133814487 [Humulus lupulus]|uniref:uncharacterized protein LOC133814487 n=1 Tax=Humulus lupulus TaxID=3486 RepID=UPI002B4040B6|nr:uncharacterized protein LOC133814487 [Humulus lupulus]